MAGEDFVGADNGVALRDGFGLVFYALRTKGDVFAKLSHGLTTFELQAKERPPSKRD